MACSSKRSEVWACGGVRGGGGGGVASLAVVIVTVKSGRGKDESHRTVLPFVQPCIIRIPLDPDPLHSAPTPEPIPSHHICSC